MRRAYHVAALLMLSSGSLSNAGSSPTGYKYDALGRLAQACVHAPGDGEISSYSYDHAGNRTHVYHQKVDIAMPADSGITSGNGRFLFWMQSDGNLVVYGNFGGGWTPLGWSTNTVGSGAKIAYFQSDGNLVLYDANGASVWSSQTAGANCASLKVKNDGNVVIADTSGTAIWATNTGGH